MALRVLLADESSTIKKVFQLALQDFAVEVKPVNVGTDVIMVAKTFKPDIIFADVLLQKKSGYEVASEVKQDPVLNQVPVVLMWSGFMELDEDKFQASQANAQLEKPFDVAGLRKLVSELVPKTQGQRLSQFLSFPPTPEFQEPKEPEVPPPAPSEAVDEFKPMSIPKMKSTQSDKYKVNLSPEELDPNSLPIDLDDIDMDSDSAQLLGADEEEDAFAIRDARKRPQAREEALEQTSTYIGSSEGTRVVRPTPAAAGASVPSLSEAQLEKIIRAQSAEVIESIVWKVVPDLATQIIERELNRLLKERDALMR
jgi:two-component system cell cycle response regulator